MEIWLPGTSSETPKKEIAEGIELATRKNNHIENYQCRDRLTALHLQEDGKTGSKFLADRRTGPTASYNCHGLAFACRRTEVNSPDAIRLILQDDLYHEVAAADVMPGDVVLYFAEDGDAEHSGIVVGEPDEVFGIPRVVSKWGKGGEFVHRANQCPYNFAGAKYYRVIDDET